MKHLSLVCLYMFLGLWLAACGSGVSEPEQRFQPYPEEAQILGLANAFRATAQTCGTQQFPAAPALTWVEAIGDVAWFHSLDMARADTENHVGANTVERLRARGFDAGETSENRKKTVLPGNPQEVFNLWAADPEACAKIMNPKYINMGAGYAGHHDGITSGAYWTQILSAPRANQPAPSLTLSPNTALTTVGSTTPTSFQAILTGSNEAIVWNLSGPGAIATQAAIATYTPPASGNGGTATLTATAGVLSASATITINPASPSLTVTPATALVAVGSGPIQFKASSNQVTWEMSGGIGTFSWAGDTFTYFPPATGLGGTATITARSGDLTASATVTVMSLSITPNTVSAAVGGAAIPFSASLSNATETINWSLTGPGSISSNTGATTSYTPPATGDAGTATLTATAGVLTASATITIIGPPDLQQFLTLINEFRSQQQTCFNGDVQETMPAVAPVAYDASLNTAARLHSEDMATNNFFSHTGSNGSSFSQRIMAQGYTGSPQGENIAGGSDTVLGAFNSWRQSRDGHCQGMMSANANEIGLGYGFSSNSQWTHYWTLVMGKK